MTPRRVTPEGHVLQAIRGYLKACRLGFVRRVNAGQVQVGEAPTHPWAKDNRRRVHLAEPGHSDLVVELERDTRCIFIEVKSAVGKVTKLQEAFLNRQRQRGHFAFVARSILDVYLELTRMGFRGLPRPHGAPPGCPDSGGEGPRVPSSSSEGERREK